MKDLISKHTNDPNFVPTSTPFVGKSVAFFTRTTNVRNRKLEGEFSQITRILKALKVNGISLRGIKSICVLPERGSGHEHRAEARAIFKHMDDMDVVICSDATRITTNYDDKSFLKRLFSSKALLTLIDDDVKQVVFDDLDNILISEKETISYDNLGLQDGEN